MARESVYQLRNKYPSRASSERPRAKNMQITIPAKVLYLGPINSNAERIFQISRSIKQCYETVSKFLNHNFFCFMRPCRKGKYQSTDNTKIRKERVTCYMWHPSLLGVYIHLLSSDFKKDICDCQDVLVKLPCVYMHLSSGDLFVFSIIVSSFFSQFCVFQFYNFPLLFSFS